MAQAKGDRRTSEGKHAIGLDIGATAIRAALLKSGRGSGSRPTIIRLAEMPLPAGTIVGGSVEQTAALSKAIRSLWRAGNFRPRTARFNLPEDIVLTRRTSAPWMVEEDFGAALRYQVADALPIDIDSVQLDYYPLGDREEMQSSGRSNRVKDILLVAAPTEEISVRATAMLRARVEPLGADTTAFALIRSAYVGLQQDDGLVHAVVDIGGAQLTTAIHRMGVPLFVRAISNSAGSAAVDAVARATDSADDRAFAERLAVSAGLSGNAPIVTGIAESSVFATHVEATGAENPDQGSIDDELRHAAARALDPWANTLIREIRETLDFYGATATNPIATVTLAGRTASMQGLIERLATSVPYRVLRFDPLADLPAHRRVLKAAPTDSRFATAIGLALGTTT